MAYEIPASLKYDEKVAFGLTFRQLMLFTIFGIASAVVFLKAPIAMEYKAISILCFMGFAAASAFLDIDRKLYRLFEYYRGIRRIGYLDRRALKLFEVKTVEDDVIIMNDGRRLAILSCTPLNLSVKSDEEREAIVKSFREFLCSLSFPVQINIRTVDTLRDLRDYFDEFEKRIDKKKNKDAYVMYLEHRKFFEDYVRENSIKNRMFYLVVPYQSAEVEKSMQELNIRAEVLREKLAATGIPSKRLNTNQLISLLASYFEEFVEVDNDYLFPVTILGKRKGI
jgi:hypothetical protein